MQCVLLLAHVTFLRIYSVQISLTVKCWRVPSSRCRLPPQASQPLWWQTCFESWKCRKWRSARMDRHQSRFTKRHFCVRLIHLHTLKGCTLEILVIMHSAWTMTFNIGINLPLSCFGLTQAGKVSSWAFPVRSEIFEGITTENHRATN